MIRLTVPSIDEDDLRAVREVLISGYLVQRSHVAALEQAVGQYVGSKCAIAVSNGTAALHLSLLALGVTPGDLVIVPAYSFVATANVVELCGAQPVFVDIRPDTFNMDPDRLKETITQLMSKGETARRVKAILPVHNFGQVADMPAIMRLAEENKLPVVEDAACALGAKLQGRQAGTWGFMACFSFHPRKVITTGEGGIITTSDPAIARHLRALRNHGQDPEAESPDFILAGFNYRMTEIQGALGTTQMKKLERIIAARRRLAARYNALLSETPLRAPIVSEGSEPIYQSYVALLPENMAIRRSQLIRNLKDEGIETTIGTWHIPMTTHFRTTYKYKAGDFPVTDQISALAITLPLYEQLAEHEQQRIVQQLQKELSKWN
jgi:dTDP-4-amino-4,6-dideoxygalactose transaminase